MLFIGGERRCFGNDSTSSSSVVDVYERVGLVFRLGAVGSIGTGARIGTGE